MHHVDCDSFVRIHEEIRRQLIQNARKPQVQGDTIPERVDNNRALLRLDIVDILQPQNVRSLTAFAGKLDSGHDSGNPAQRPVQDFLIQWLQQIPLSNLIPLIDEPGVIGDEDNRRAIWPGLQCFCQVKAVGDLGANLQKGDIESGGAG